jgi:pyrroloquinoline quinone biosynthesis protein E
VYPKQVDNCGLCEFSPGCSGIPVKENQDIAGKLSHIPIKHREAKIELTYKCNMKCDFCFNVNSKQEGPDQDTGRVIEMLDILKEHGFERIRFTGGEPLLRKDLPELIQYAKLKDFHTILNTNGLLIDESLKKIAIEEVDDLLISFHGLPEPGTIEEKKLAIIRGISGLTRVLVDTIATPENVDHFDRYNEIFRNMDVIWYFLRPVSGPGGAIISRDKMIQLITRIHMENNARLKKGILRKIEITAVPYCIYKPEITSAISSGSSTCGLGETLTINPEGNVRFCYSIGRPDMNLFSVDLDDILSDPFFINYKSGKAIPAACKQCFYLRNCLGGCRFEAYLATGKIHGEDPFANPSVLFNSRRIFYP